MTSDIGYALLLGSMSLIILSAVVTMIVPRRAPRERKRREQRAALADLLGTADGPTLELDWFRFGEVPMEELVLLAQEHNWRLDSDQITDTAWVLRFTKSP